MTTLWETQTLDDLQAEEARKHNAMIRERYRLLQNAEEAQLEKTFAEAEQQKRARAIYRACGTRRAGCSRGARSARGACCKNAGESGTAHRAAERFVYGGYIPQSGFRRGGSASRGSDARAGARIPSRIRSGRSERTGKSGRKERGKSLGKLFAYQCGESRDCPRWRRLWCC